MTTHSAFHLKHLMFYIILCLLLSSTPNRMLAPREQVMTFVRARVCVLWCWVTLSCSTHCLFEHFPPHNPKFQRFIFKRGLKPQCSQLQRLEMFSPPSGFLVLHNLFLPRPFHACLFANSLPLLLLGLSCAFFLTPYTGIGCLT